jgi:phosphonate transport system substrate-binding protein
MKNFLLSLLCIFILSCNGYKTDSFNNPDKLIIGIYAGDNPNQTKENIVFFQKYLEKELGKEVEYIFTSDYTTLVEGIQRKKLHIAQLSPFSYVLATRKPCLVPLVTFGLNNKPSSYHSIIFSNSQSAIKNISDLQKNAKNLTLCFGDPASTSGHLLPRAYLKSIGFEPDSSFKQVVFTGTHAATILSIKSKKIDIGCSSSDLALDRLIREGVVKQSDFNILWTSDDIINDTFSASIDLDKKLIEKIKKTYLEVHKKDFNAFSKSIFRFYPDARKRQFIPVSDSMYNSLRKVAANIKELK